MKPFRRKTIFCYCFCRSVIVWQDGNVTFYSTTTTPLIWKRDRMSCRRKTPQLHSTIPNILRDISVFAVCFPCHPVEKSEINAGKVRTYLPCNRYTSNPLGEQSVLPVKGQQATERFKYCYLLKGGMYTKYVASPQSPH